ncbi:hypothetical protein ACQ4M4_28360 [Leptolyngbya sp. AN02str]|uniref:hypothetical protein n=1 Tax=Leptolyngbya sp. AN02str TaxID=3423363 RepID=UPI003D31C5E1
MLISTSVYVPFSRELVFATYRDRLVELVPYMPNIRQVEVKLRRDMGTHIDLVNEWHGGGDIPSAARAILNESMLSWTEQARWDAANYLTDWQIKTHAYTEAVLCKGKNRFVESQGGTLIESKGELSIDSRQIREVPQFLAGMVGGIVEDFLGKKIEPNLVQMSEGVRRYLEQQASSTTR